MAYYNELSVGMLTQEGDGSSSAFKILSKDLSGYITMCEGTTVPSSAGSGYAPGCMFRKTDTSLGQSFWFQNTGSATSCVFAPVGPVAGYGFAVAGGNITTAGGDTTETIELQGLVRGTTDISFVNHGASDDSDNIVAQALTNGLITITASADPSTAHGYYYGVLRNKCTPQFDVFAAGTHTTVGGAAAEAITVTGVLATDICFVCYSATNDTDTITKVVPTANTLTVTCSADPSTAHGIHYCVLRERGSFRPSHYVAYAGVHTTVGGAAAEAITVTGAAATDIPIVFYHTTNDTDTILKSVVTANTLTVTMSADPSTAHKLAYMLLRAYA